MVHGMSTPKAHLLQAPQLHEVQPIVLQELVLLSASVASSGRVEAPPAGMLHAALGHKFDNPACTHMKYQANVIGDQWSSQHALHFTSPQSLEGRKRDNWHCTCE